MTNIIQMPDSLNRRVPRIHVAHERTQHGRQEWIEGTIELAIELAAARAEFPSNHGFGVWLAENDIDDYTKDDRAALIGMGENIDITRRVLAETDRMSWHWIWWQLIKPLLQMKNTDPVPGSPPDSPETPSPAPEIAASVPVEATESAPKPPGDIGPTSQPPKPRGKLSPRLKGRDRLTRVLEYVLDTDTRKTIAELCGRNERGNFRNHHTWGLIIDSIESGAFGPPSDICLTTPTLCLVLPWADRAYAKRYDLTSQRDCTCIRELLPAIAANLDALRADPHALPMLIARIAADKKKAADAIDEAGRRERLLSTLKVTEYPIIMYGEHLWPIEGSKYSYLDVCAACWFFHALDGCWRESFTADDKAIQGRHTIKWLRPLLEAGNSKAADVITAIFNALATNPVGECRLPPMPTNYKG